MEYLIFCSLKAMLQSRKMDIDKSFKINGFYNLNFKIAKIYLKIAFRVYKLIDTNIHFN